MNHIRTGPSDLDAGASISRYHPLICIFNSFVRLCPGRYLAEGSVWIAIAYILSTLSISKALDENGEEITPQVGFTAGITRCFGLPLAFSGLPN